MTDNDLGVTCTLNYFIISCNQARYKYTIKQMVIGKVDNKYTVKYIENKYNQTKEKE